MTKRLWAAFTLAVVGLSPMVTVTGPVAHHSNYERFLTISLFVGLFGVGLFLHQYLSGRK